jgi:type II protein arginine methyltransferase
MAEQTPPSTANPLSDPARFLELGQQLAADKAGGLAIALVERALAVHGDDPLWQALADAVLRHEVPTLHARMLRDGLRNAAYRAAIERYAPGRKVLDIGTGSGLLAMMAARAGAAKVYACEANAMLAAAARTVIAANGLADRITVFDRHSGKLDRMRDLNGGVDLVVSEVFSDCLVGEGVLETLAHARSELAGLVGFLIDRFLGFYRLNGLVI